MYIFDTREKKNSHIKAYFIKQGIPYEEKKLDFGDYFNDKKPQIIVDRKQNLDELLGNLFSADKERFIREIKGAKDKGIQLIFLCEHSPRVKTLDDVRKWQSKYSKISGKALASKLMAIKLSYGVNILFCSKASTGKMIHQLLKED